MNIEEVQKLDYWDLVELLNQWKENNRSIECKNCKKCTNTKKSRLNT
jgi:hypothetical protein